MKEKISFICEWHNVDLAQLISMNHGSKTTFEVLGCNKIKVTIEK